LKKRSSRASRGRNGDCAGVGGGRVTKKRCNNEAREKLKRQGISSGRMGLVLVGRPQISFLKKELQIESWEGRIDL